MRRPDRPALRAGNPIDSPGIADLLTSLMDLGIIGTLQSPFPRHVGVDPALGVLLGVVPKALPNLLWRVILYLSCILNGAVVELLPYIEVSTYGSVMSRWIYQ